VSLLGDVQEEVGGQKKQNEFRKCLGNFFDDLNFTCHCWMRAPDDHVLAATDCGQVLLFRSGEYVCHIPCSPGAQYPIYSIISIQGGFVWMETKQPASNVPFRIATASASFFFASSTCCLTSIY
jgi:hypothetical protein